MNYGDILHFLILNFITFYWFKYKIMDNQSVIELIQFKNILQRNNNTMKKEDREK